MAQFTRYPDMLKTQGSAGLRSARSAGADANAGGLGLALPAGLILLDDAENHDAALAGAIVALGQADGADPRGGVYRMLAVHLALAAFAKRYELMSVHDWSACEDAVPAMVESMQSVAAYTQSPPPGESVARVLWSCLCLVESSKLAARDADLDWLDAVVGQIIDHGGTDKPLHQQDPDASLDAWTYRELVGLHALSWLALLLDRRDWWTRVGQIARYHLHHTQPDNTTNQPWGLMAFALDRETCSFADQQLHDAQTWISGQSPGSEGQLLTSLLLADAYHAMRSFHK